MKMMKKVAGIALALVMALVLMAPAFAAEGEKTITVTPPTGTMEGVENTYKIYKVFDGAGNGINISYKLLDGKTVAPEGFSVDGAGNVTYIGEGTDALTKDDIDAIADYVAGDTPVATVTTTGDTPKTVALTTGDGYYYITTTNGSVVTVTSANPNAVVEDKNTVPTVDKVGSATETGTGAKNLVVVQGGTVYYTVTITAGKGAQNYVLHDTMTNQTFGGSVTVTGADDYSLNQSPEDGHAFDLVINGNPAEGTVITVKYTATLNDTTGVNTVWVTYGDLTALNKTPSSSVNVYTAQMTVTKTDGNNTETTEDDTALAGAGFVIARDNGGTTEYYKLDNGVVTWVNSIDNADEHLSDANGHVEPFEGLGIGTYTLIENTIPAGYNKAADKPFAVSEVQINNGAPTNLALAETIVNNTGSLLPATGGIGTTIFYIGGSILVAGAAILLITKKRMGSVD